MFSQTDEKFQSSYALAELGKFADGIFWKYPCGQVFTYTTPWVRTAFIWRQCPHHTLPLTSFSCRLSRWLALTTCCSIIDQLKASLGRSARFSVPAFLVLYNLLTHFGQQCGIGIKCKWQLQQVCSIYWSYSRSNCWLSNCSRFALLV